MSYQETCWEDFVLADKPNSDGGEIALVVNDMPFAVSADIFVNREDKDIVLVSGEQGLRLKSVAEWALQGFSQNMPFVLVDVKGDRVLATRRA